jgi:pimeloyl-ACP methyl ester carboxylesterase
MKVERALGQSAADDELRRRTSGEIRLGGHPGGHLGGSLERQPLGAVSRKGTSTFVLVHGFWHDRTAWGRVIRRLTDLGHNAFAPAIPGHGWGADTRVSHAESTQSVVEFIAGRDLRDIVLVGHSFGGTIISKVAALIPDRIRRLVFYSGFVLNDGQSVNDAVPPHYRALFAELAKDSPDNSVMLPFPIWHQAFINDADVYLARWSYAQLSPAPYQQVLEPLNLTKFYALDTPRSYLTGDADVALPPGDWGWHPRMSSRLGPHRLVQMPGSHELIFSNPFGLADKIIEAGLE